MYGDVRAGGRLGGDHDETDRAGQAPHRERGTYTGIAAVFQGVQFNVLGLFLILVAVMTSMRANGREMFLQFVRRPGLPLIGFGILVLMQAVITMLGSLEQQERSRRDVIFSLLLSRLLPGTMLILVGLGMTGLGLFEAVAPNVFDAMGGGFLERLYELR
ncbi:MAG: hypothetical protein ACM3XO_13475 [Bacteroidota bacterium]